MPDILTGEHTPEQDFIPAGVDDDTIVNIDETADSDESPAVVTAREQGWVPEDEWTGAPEQWVEAKEFVFRGSLYDRISAESSSNRKLSKQVDELNTAMQALGEHNKSIAKREYAAALRDLNTQKSDAIDSRDGELVVELDAKLDELKELRPVEDEVTPVVEEPTAPPVEVVEKMTAWKQDNSWYESSVGLRSAADGIGQQYVSDNPHATFDEVLQYVSVEMAKEFSDKIATPARRQSAVTIPGESRPRSSGGKAAKYAERDLSDEQRNIGKTFVRSGAFESMQLYVDQLADMGELPSQQ